MPKAWFFVLYIALVVANRYFLISRGHGLKFDQEFAHLGKFKKICLVIGSLVAVALAVMFFVLSAQAHRRLLGVRD